MVNWRRHISAFLLVVLAMLPVSSTLCAALCDSPAKPVSAHHAPGTTCEESSRSSGGPAIAPTPHDCTAHGSTPDVGLMPAPRPDLNPGPAFLAIATSEATFVPVASDLAPIAYASPPGSAPPTTIPLVLRV